MPLDIVVGIQWGDEGKGRIVDLLAADADYVARFNGGDNAGHTVTVGSQTFKLHLVPSGVVHPHAVSMIGNGVVVNPVTLLSELDFLKSTGVSVTPERLRISYAAHLITPGHLALDKAQEEQRGKTKIGTTLRGIGPAYTAKVTRSGLRMGQMLDQEAFADAVEEHIKQVNRQLTGIYEAETLNSQKIAGEMADYARQLAPYIGDVSSILHKALQNGRRVLAEGAQGTLLDLDHGTYPYVTSSNPTAPGALVGLGLGVGCVDRVIGVTKAFQTRVGEGSFPTEVSGEAATRLRGTGENPWDEFGTTTGRPRRVGWLDLVLLRYAVRINGATELALTKLDVLSGLKTVKICVAYRERAVSPQEVPVLSELPLGPGSLDAYEPVYEELPGWEKDLQTVRKWEDLPEEARSYVLRIQELSGIPVRMVSVGPERGQMVEIA